MTYATHAGNDLIVGSAWPRTIVYGATVLAAASAWVGLWLLAVNHVGPDAMDALGPGMGALERMLDAVGLSTGTSGTIWNEICRALVSVSSPEVGMWSVEQATLVLVMWLVMAIGMMLPTAAPAILAFSDINRAAQEKYLPNASPAVFTSGYLLIWSTLGFAATALQWVFSGGIAQHVGLLESLPFVGASILIAAGAYQWSALKEACLTQCRSPMRFFLSQWQEGSMGALRMGMHHGLYCAGCCWALMALMFVGGTMNLVWMAVLTVVMLLEKIVPHGHSFGRAIGIVLIIWGAGLVTIELL